MKFNDYKSEFESANLTGAPRLPKAENCLAIVLAGGSGLPAKGLIPAGARRQRPPQFSRTAGSEILLDKTRKQIEKAFSKRKTMYVVTERHEPYYREVLSDVEPENLIIQPQDVGTAVAILYAALRMAIINPSAILAFFPADFHAASEIEFMQRVESACTFARRDPNLILLGIKPDDAKTKDEWIEFDPSAPVDKNFGVWRVRRFLSRPTPAMTRQLLGSGALLNSSVMVGTPATFLRKIRRAAPGLYGRFSLAAERIGTASEPRAVRAAYYSQYSQTDFSRDVLEKSEEKLLVAPVPASLKTAIGIEPPATGAKVSGATVVNAAPPRVYAARLGA